MARHGGSNAESGTDGPANRERAAQESSAQESAAPDAAGLGTGEGPALVRKRYLLLAFLVLWAVLIAGGAALYQWAEARNTAYHERLFNRMQANQVALAAAGIDEHLRNLTNRLAFAAREAPPAGAAGTRARLDAVAAALPDDEAEVRAFALVGEDGALGRRIRRDTAPDALLAETVESYADRLARGAPSGDRWAPEFVLTPEHQLAGWAVRRDAAGAGGPDDWVLFVVDLGVLFERYVARMRLGDHGAGYVLDGTGRVAYDHESQIIGRSVFEGLHDDYPELREIDSRIVAEESGLGAYRFLVERGGAEARKLIAWDTAALGERALKVALAKPDTEINAALDIQRTTLGLGMALLAAALIATMALFFRLRQRLLTQANRMLTERVAARTERLDRELAARERTEAELRRAHDDLRYERRQLAEVIEGTGVGTWEWDPFAGTITCNERWAEIAGYRLAELEPIDDATWRDLCHPEDLAVSDERLRRHQAGEIDHYDCDLRVRHKAGEWVWVHDRGKVIARDEEGRPLRLAGTRTDISARKRDEARLREAQAEAQRAHEILIDAIESLDDAFVLFDADERLVVCNSKYREYYAASADLFVPGARLEDILREGVRRGQYPDAAGREEAWVAERLAAHRAADGSVEQRLPDGRWVRVTERPTRAGGHVGFRVDITELKTAKEAAEKATRSKSEFLASMSHELRTPLNAILGYGQMLELELGGELSSRQTEYVDAIVESGNALLQLVNDILDLAKIEADKLPLYVEEVDAAETLAACLREMQPMFRARDLAVIDRSGMTAGARVRTDRTRFRQIVINLLSNAVKYNREGGRLTLGAEETSDGFLRVTVADTGRGIPPQRRPYLFRLFERAGSDPMTAGEGAGVGLAVSKMLADRLGGRIDFDSEVDVGSTFRIDLPLADNDRVFVWSEVYRTGIDALDKDRQHLFALANRLLGVDPEDAASDDALAEMLVYARYHLRREDTVLAVCAPPDLAARQEANRAAAARLDEAAAVWRRDGDAAARAALRDTLRQWLAGHVTDADSVLGEHATGKEFEIRERLAGVA